MMALLVDFTWQWQLTSTLLETYKAVTDHDGSNLKRPDVALRALCLRTQASATRSNRSQ